MYIERKLGEKKRRKREKVDSAEAENAFQAEIEGKIFCYMFDGFGISKFCAYSCGFLFAEHDSSKAMDGKKSKNSSGKKKVKSENCIDDIFRF